MDKPLNIALIGSAPSSVRLAPYGNPEWQVWACSPGAWGSISSIGLNPLERVHLWFELHRYEPGQPWFSQDYCAFLAKHPRVVMAETRPDIPNSLRCPVEELVTEFGPYFFTSSLAFMFAMAIKMKPAKIGLWGVDMAATEEYGYQRAGCQYFGMLARAMGIEVGVPPESDLFRPAPLYGVSEIDHERIKLMARRRELAERKARAEQTIQQATAELQCMHGALDDLTYMENTWAGNIPGHKYVEPPVVPALRALVAGSERTE